MKVNRCLHAALLVSDLAKAEYFYGEVLGLAKVDRDLKFPGAWYEVDDFQIHLMTNPDPGTNLQDAEKWGRNRHVAFAVEDLESAKTQLQAAGCPMQTSSSGRSALFTRDPDGNVIELSQA